MNIFMILRTCEEFPCFFKNNFVFCLKKTGKKISSKSKITPKQFYLRCNEGKIRHLLSFYLKSAYLTTKHIYICSVKGLKD